MVHYIFSDKTGTLTQNVMEFKRFSAGPVCYGKEHPEPQEYALGVTNVNFEDEAAFNHLNSGDHSNNSFITRFREALGVCHTIIIEQKEDPESGEVYSEYNASSPDELALDNGARHLGFAFTKRDQDGNMCCTVEGKAEE
jgi:magnesium-transporting ATPase (P-type)